MANSHADFPVIRMRVSERIARICKLRVGRIFRCSFKDITLRRFEFWPLSQLFLLPSSFFFLLLHLLPFPLSPFPPPFLSPSPSPIPIPPPPIPSSPSSPPFRSFPQDLAFRKLNPFRRMGSGKATDSFEVESLRTLRPRKKLRLMSEAIMATLEV